MKIFTTFALMAGLTAVLMALGGAVGGQMGIVFALVFAVLMNGISYWFSDRIVLKMYHAREVDQHSAPDLWWQVKELAEKASLPMPRVYIIDTPTPNAFATGRNPEHAAVAVTTGIMRALNKAELSGVIAHELSHVRHYDILIGSVAGTIVGAVSSLAWMGQWALIFGMGRGNNDDEGGGGFGALLLVILAPIIATVLQLAISRQREYAADRGAAVITGNPGALADALVKIHNGNVALPMESGPATAHMFIANPLSGRSMMQLFSTHPPMEKRVELLRQMARDGVRV